MSLRTYSKFYYGQTVTDENQSIDFVEDGDVKKASVEVGSYTLTRFLEVVAAAINAALITSCSVSINRATRIITIDFDDAVDILGATGDTVATSVLPLLGIAAADYIGVTQVVGTSPCGFEWAPQCKMQDHVDPSLSYRAANATVNKSASGKVSVQSFGRESFLKGRFPYITDIDQGADFIIETQQNAVQNMKDFFEYATTKAPIEFMEDRDKPGSYIKVLLTSTAQNADGVGFEPTELVGRGLPGYYDTGTLVFQVIEVED